MEALHADGRFNLTGLVCQPDKPAGRKGLMKKPASKEIAETLDIPIYQPEKIADAEDLLLQLRADAPDFILTFAYGQILNAEWLGLPKVEPLNVHASLLPKYRGASPIQSAILAGDDETGVSLMRMVRKMDAGPVFSTRKIELSSQMTAGLLHDELASIAATFVPDELLKVKTGVIDSHEQNEAEATYCKKISRENGKVDFKKSAEEILRSFRAYSPWPGLWTTYKGKRLKLIDVETVKGDLPVGSVQCGDGKILIGTSDGLLNVKQLQLEGKQCLHAGPFSIGQPEFCSDHLPS